MTEWLPPTTQTSQMKTVNGREIPVAKRPICIPDRACNFSVRKARKEKAMMLFYYLYDRVEAIGDKLKAK